MQMTQYCWQKVPQELQTALCGMQHYCTIWKLEVNVNKTVKVMMFSRERSRNTPNFVYNGNRLEVVFVFRYLGVDFNFNGKFNLCEKNIFSTRHRKPRMQYFGKVECLDYL